MWCRQSAVDGLTGFERLCKIVNDLQELGQDDNWSKAIKKSLLDGKRYLKTQYRNHCNESESPCPDHCLKFGLSDPKNADFNETCAHEHSYIAIEFYCNVSNNSSFLFPPRLHFADNSPGDWERIIVNFTSGLHIPRRLISGLMQLFCNCCRSERA